MEYSNTTCSKQLLYEEESQGSAVWNLPHSDIMPILDGAVKGELASRKGQEAEEVTFRGHCVFASNETFAEAFRKRPT